MQFFVLFPFTIPPRFVCPIAAEKANFDGWISLGAIAREPTKQLKLTVLRISVRICRQSHLSPEPKVARSNRARRTT
jgi:hypothetical protein